MKKMTFAVIIALILTQTNIRGEDSLSIAVLPLVKTDNTEKHCESGLVVHETVCRNLQELNGLNCTEIRTIYQQVLKPFHYTPFKKQTPEILKKMTRFLIDKNYQWVIGGTYSYNEKQKTVNYKITITQNRLFNKTYENTFSANCPKGIFTQQKKVVRWILNCLLEEAVSSDNIISPSDVVTYEPQDDKSYPLYAKAKWMFITNQTRPALSNALSFLKKSLNDSPGFLPALYLKSRIQVRLGDYLKIEESSAANHFYNHALSSAILGFETDPDWFRFPLFEAALRLNLLRTAADAFKSIKNPEEKDPVSTALFYKAVSDDPETYHDVFQNQSPIEQAVKSAQKAKTVFPRSFYNDYLYTFILTHKSANSKGDSVYKQIRRETVHLIKNYPDNPMAYVIAAKFYLNTDNPFFKPEIAHDLAEKASVKAKDTIIPAVKLILAESSYQIGKSRKALKMMESIKDNISKDIYISLIRKYKCSKVLGDFKD